MNKWKLITGLLSILSVPSISSATESPRELSDELYICSAEGRCVETSSAEMKDLYMRGTMSKESSPLRSSRPLSESLYDRLQSHGLVDPVDWSATDAVICGSQCDSPTK